MLDVGRGDDEVGFEAEDGVEVAGAETADARLFDFARRRAVEGGDPDDLRPRAEPLEDVGTVGSESDDALGDAGFRHNRKA